METTMQILIPALIALICTMWIRPYVLKIAIEKNIVDNPDARKLQRSPVPVLGGLTVIFGVLTGLMGFSLLGESYHLFPIFASIIIILIVGLIDDMISLSAKTRFIIEILLVLYMVQATGCQLNDFHGLWGVHYIPNYISIPLTVVSCVGIINAINLIDGVDGYSSGYSIVSSIIFGVFFYLIGNIAMVGLTAIVVAALLPFFFHNVFGKSSKMFIGDAGTLSLGIIFSVFVITTLSTAHSDIAIFGDNFGIVPFTLAVLCIPVFDTLRVMSVRIARGFSPFRPDRTHLHHLFIELKFSHIGTTIAITCINLLVILCWFVAYKCGATIEWQLYIVVALGMFVTFIFYPFVKRQIAKQTLFYRILSKIAAITHVQRKGFWLTIQKFIDGKEATDN